MTNKNETKQMSKVEDGVPKALFIPSGRPQKKTASPEELAAVIQSLISQVLFLNWFIEEQFNNLGKYEKISRKGKTGIAVTLSNENRENYEITLFPLMSGLFKGETTIGNKKIEFIVRGRIPSHQKPSIEFLAKDAVGAESNVS